MVKKRYAGITSDGKLLITGLEAKRSDWSMVARRTQKELLIMILKDGADEEAVKEYLHNLKETYRNLPIADFILEKIIDTSRVYTMQTNILKAYETLYEVVHEGNTYKAKSPYEVDALIGIRWIYGRKGMPIGIPDEDSPDDYRGRIDYEYYWDNQIMPPIERLFDAIKYNVNNYTQTTLF